MLPEDKLKAIEELRQRYGVAGAWRMTETSRVLKQNITLSIGIKALFLALNFSGAATLWMAVFADMGASLIVVFNGLRLLRFRK
ncbi:MAG: hypothetical protein ACOY2B_08995 [Pseudomonadota bacterium]